MNWDAWIIIGWLGQACFFSRFLVQWLLSEKQGRSVTPASFWWLSLIGSVTVGLVAGVKEEWILVPAYLINGSIYLRNLLLGTKGEGRSSLGPLMAGGIGLFVAIPLLVWGLSRQEDAADLALPFLLAGILGQAVWSTRFLVQWWFTERAGKSHFPLAFWWMSLIGALLNIVYTSQLETMLFLVGMLPAWFVPLRNIMIESKRRRLEQQAT